MYPIHDADAILMLAMSVAAKRRPAELVEIIAAADLLAGVIPGETELSDSFCRLSEYGLIRAQDGGYALTPDGQHILSGQAKKARSQERIRDIRENLADFHLSGGHAIVLVEPALLLAAINEYKKARSSGRSWLTEKPKPVWVSKKDLVRGVPHPRKRRG
jgi:hypothetical protein